MKIPPTPVALTLMVKVGGGEPTVFEFANFDLEVKVTSNNGEMSMGLDMAAYKSLIAEEVLSLGRALRDADVKDIASTIHTNKEIA